ncbi:hypothetical protein BRD15_05485 [Halobacteriales archaeon SW_6_65_15]|jgi:hypothetical protein|nr:MAG: hypothetical protein BRD15_05485 [Halobacteriales archaeon SW_6_65_15]
MHRRTLLTALGATTATLGTGCLSSVEERLDPSVRLGWFGAHNFDTEPHQFDLQLTRDGTRVHHSSHEIRPRDGNYVHSGVADCDWGSASGDYVVRARVDSNEWKEASITEFLTSREPDCAVANAEYRDDGLQFFLRDGCDRDWNGTCSFTTR